MSLIADYISGGKVPNNDYSYLQRGTQKWKCIEDPIEQNRQSREHVQSKLSYEDTFSVFLSVDLSWTDESSIDRTEPHRHRKAGWDFTIVNKKLDAGRPKKVKKIKRPGFIKAVD